MLIEKTDRSKVVRKKISTILIFVLTLIQLLVFGEPCTYADSLQPGSGFTGPTTEPGPVGTPGQDGYDANAIARWDVVPYQEFNSVFEIGVVAFHMIGIDRVEFSAEGGPWTSVTEMTLNPRTGVNEYWAVLDAADCSDGPVEVRAIAYPEVGQPRLLDSLYLYANAGGTLTTLIIYVSHDGNDSNPGTLQSPMRTITYAIDKFGKTPCETYNECTGRIILLNEGIYELRASQQRAAFKFHNQRYITVEPAAGLNRDNVIIGFPTRQVSRPYVDKLHFKNLSFDFSTISQYYGGEAIWFDNCRWFESEGWTASYPDTRLKPVRANFYATDSLAEDMLYGFTWAQLVRNSTTRKISGDAYQGSMMILNCQAINVDGTVRSHHSDIYQIIGHHQNVIVYGLDTENITWTQCMFLDHYQSSHTDYAFVDIYFDCFDENGGPPLTQFNAPHNHVILRNVRWPGQRMIFRTDFDPPKQFTANNVIFENCELYPTDYDRYVDPGTDRPEGVTFRNCYPAGETPDDTPPTIPQNLQAQPISENQIDLSWDASTDSESGVDHYNIYRDSSFIAQSASTSYQDTSLSGETTYTYEVSAVNGQGLESDRSSAVSETTLADNTAAEILSVNTTSDTSVVVVFNEPLEPASAQNISNYSITGGISISSASLSDDLTKVTLTTSAHTEEVTYTLTVTGVQDTSGNIISQTQLNYQYTQALIGHWAFDDGAGTTASDSSGNGNTGTLLNGPTWTTGQIDGALSFDGSNDYVSVGTNGLSSASGTISAWFNANSILTGSDYSYIYIHYHAGNRILFYLNQNRLKLGLGSSNFLGDGVSISLGQWYFCTMTWDNGNYALYLNGIYQYGGTYSGLSSITSTARIGGWSSPEYFNGIIDDARVYNRALSADEVLALYNEAVGTNQAPVMSSIGDKSVSESEILTFTVNATDADGDTITYSAQNLPSGASFSGQSFNWTPSYEQSGAYQVTFIASDGRAADSEAITITVNNINRAPVLTAIGDKSVDENSTLSFSVNATDADGDTIIHSVENLPSGAAFASPFSWTPGYDQAGTYQVTFIAGDGQAQDSETITITVNNANRAPVLSAIGNKSVYATDLLTFTVSATDPDGDAITYSVNGLPSGATFVNQTFSWTPGQSQAGSYEVAFTTSDGQLQDSETITLTVNAADTLPPAVTNLSPAADSIQAPLNSLIYLDVTDSGKGVDPSTVTIEVNSNLICTGNTTDYTSSYGRCRRIGTSAAYTYVYQKDEPFDYDQTVTVTVNATDLAGNAMDEYSYSFRTEMHSFGKNKKVNSDSDNLSKGRPVTVRDSGGDIWAAWHAGPADSRDIYIGRLAAGADNFDGSLQLTSNAADQRNPAIGIGSNDKLYVAWQDNRRGNWDIYISTSIDGINWSAERRVTDSNDNHTNPAIAVDGSLPNNAYIVWQDDQGGNQDIYLATSSNDFLTKTVSRITTDTSDQLEPAIAVDSDNTIYVVWTDARDGSNDIYGAASNNGPWTNISIVSNANNQSSPVIAAEAVGSILHLIWVDDTSGNRDIYYATSDGLPGSPLTGNSIIDDSSGADQLEPVIVTTGSTGDGLKVFACWQDERNTDTDLYFAELSSGHKTNVFVGDNSTNTDQGEPAIATDEYGQPYLVWTDARNANPEIYYAGSTFAKPVVLASEDVSVSSDATVGTEPEAINAIDDVSVVVPAGASSCDIKITISTINNPQAFAMECLGGYDFGPSGIEFNKPVTVTIPYNVSDSSASTSAYWYNSLTGALSQQGITNVEDIVVSPTLHALRFETTHFTQFYLLLGSGTAAAGGGGGCSVSPDNQGSIAEFLLPYIGLTVMMVIMRLIDVRNQRARKITK